MDLSAYGRDFRPIAVEPGLALLDRSGSNARILFTWLGGMAAEPEWEGDAVRFFVRDDAGGRLEEVSVSPASAEELRTTLAAEMQKLRDRLERAKPESASECVVHEILLRHFRELTEGPARADLDKHFFKYRDAADNWRLVWCWGYQRNDQEPAPAALCPVEACRLLFVRRAGKTRCPACEAAVPVAERQPTAGLFKRAMRIAAFALLVLLCLVLLGTAGYWLVLGNRLIAAPAAWTGPVGGQIPLVVRQDRVFWRPDVTARGEVLVDDPRLVRYDADSATATALSPGGTRLRFLLGDRSVEVPVTVQPARQPAKLAIVPAAVRLGVGTTQRLRLVGVYADGSQADLTAGAEWSARNDGVLFALGGFLEGLAAGKSAATARYRAGPELPYLEASATVTVEAIDVRAVEARIESSPLRRGGTSRLQIDAVTDRGERFSLLESSRLSARVEPPQRATYRGSVLRGDQPGWGRLVVHYDGRLSAEAELEVVASTPFPLRVAPDKLDLVQGELAGLSVVGGGDSPQITSSAPAVVEITPQGRLAARRAGKAEVTVTGGGETRRVPVTVGEAAIRWLALDPPAAAVAIDDTARFRVLARVGQRQNVELDPRAVRVAGRPSPEVAGVDPAGLALSGRRATGAGRRQSLVLEVGEAALAAPVAVVPAPLRLQLTPEGPVRLPLGQVQRMAAWATYRSWRRVQVTPDRVDFFRDPAAKADQRDIVVDDNRVLAYREGAGPVYVWGKYLGSASDRVEFRTVPAEDVVLHADVDRTLRLVGEPGAVELTGTGPRGDVELVPDLAQYASSAADVLAVDAMSGGFRGAAPGTARVTVRHPAAAEAASVDLRVVDPVDAHLVFDPSRASVPVGGVAELPLVLEAETEGQKLRAAMHAPGVRYTLADPAAIDWRPPRLTGLRPARPFEIAANYYPYILDAAVARVEVTAEAPSAIRIVPPRAVLAPGQWQPLRVEGQFGNGDWRELRCDAAQWTFPPELSVHPASADLRTEVALPEQAAGTYSVKARFGDHEATAALETGAAALDPKDPEVALALVREPPGKVLAVGRSQRYAIVLEKSGVREPAVGVEWPGPFGNEYVEWQPAVLQAKEPNYTQWLEAKVGGRVVRFATRTYDPTQAEGTPPDRGDRPRAVRIVSDQGPAVEMPVGGEFDDFRVEAEYDDGFIDVVTKRATLRVDQPAETAPLAPRGDRLLGIRPGEAKVTAVFDGVKTPDALSVTVTPDVRIDALRIRPAPITLLQGETFPLEAEGLRAGRSVGLITGVDGVGWESRQPSVAAVDGPSVTGRSLGRGAVVARIGQVESAPAEVSVVPTIDDALVVDPKTLRIFAGESRYLGSDILVYRGAMEVSRLCQVVPALGSVVEFRPESGSLVGLAAGRSAVTLAIGDKLATLPVEVLPGGPVEGELVVEPASGVLAVGQSLELRVAVVTPDGRRIDRTASALLSSSAPRVAEVRAGAVCALAPGAAEIEVSLPETQRTARAYVTVNDLPITDLVVEPAGMTMAVGERSRLHILGRAASGTYPMFVQNDLKLAPGGARPEAVRIAGGHSLDAVAPGEAEVAVTWRGGLQRRVPITVTSSAWRDLRIDPIEATIAPGQGLVYRVTAMRGDRIRVLTPGDGLELYPADAAVAQPLGGLAVRGVAPGQTAVVARLGSLQAESMLRVAPDASGTYGPDVAVVGPGYGYRYGNRETWLERGPGEVWVDRQRVETVSPYVPPADAKALRFLPDVLRLAAGTPGAGVRVVEVLADGTLGRDVSAQPDLELSELTGGVATAEKTAEGVFVRPVAPGRTRMAARIGTLVTESPLVIDVAGSLAAGARLVVYPERMVLWTGERASPRSVQIVPGGGGTPFEIGYRLTAPAGQSIVATEGRSVRGLSRGIVPVTVTAVDPSHGGLSTTMEVQVGLADTLVIDPGEVALRVGQSTPRFVTLARGAEGTSHPVPAVLESADPAILAPDPNNSGAFVAKSFGSTQVRAAYRGREALARVTITGERFVEVQTRIEEGEQAFEVAVDVLAARAEGPLEYRVSVEGQPPQNTWTAATAVDDEHQRASLRSPRMAYQPRSAYYHLLLEARSPGGGAVQRYPLSFRLVPRIERIEP